MCVCGLWCGCGCEGYGGGVCVRIVESVGVRVVVIGVYVCVRAE